MHLLKKMINVLLETTANKVLCHQMEFTVILKIFNSGETADLKLRHRLGEKLQLAWHPPQVHLSGNRCDCQVAVIRLRAKHGCTRLTYNVRITDRFMLPMGRTIVELVKIDGNRVNRCSNPVSLGITPPSFKFFTVSQPVPCTGFCGKSPISNCC